MTVENIIKKLLVNIIATVLHTTYIVYWWYKTVIYAYALTRRMTRRNPESGGGRFYQFVNPSTAEITLIYQISISVCV